MSELTNDVLIEVSNISWEFVKQYYNVLYNNPEQLGNFYSKNAKFVRENKMNLAEITTENEKNKMYSCEKFKDCKIQIHKIEAMESISSSILIQVLGTSLNTENVEQNFIQTFVLCGPNEHYAIYSDILQFLPYEQTEESNVPERTMQDTIHEKENIKKSNSDLEVKIREPMAPSQDSDIIESMVICDAKPLPSASSAVSLDDSTKAVDGGSEDSTSLTNEPVPQKKMLWSTMVAKGGSSCKDDKILIQDSKSTVVNPQHSSLSATSDKIKGKLENSLNSTSGFIKSNFVKKPINSVFIKGLTPEIELNVIKVEFEKIGEVKKIEYSANKSAAILEFTSYEIKMKAIELASIIIMDTKLLIEERRPFIQNFFKNPRKATPANKAASHSSDQTTQNAVLGSRNPVPPMPNQIKPNKSRPRSKKMTKPIESVIVQ